MESQYEDRWNAVLRMIYDRGGPRHMDAVNDLASGATWAMSHRELGEILIDLDERKGFIRRQVGQVWMTPAGLEYIESIGQPKPPVGGDTYNMNIGTLHGGAQQGPGNIQNINITNHQPISEILPHLAALIEAVKAEDFPDKDDVVRDLEKAHEVALANPNASPNDGAWTRIHTKLTAAKTAMEIAGFVCKTYPYWPKVLDFFHRHIQ